MSTLLFKDMQTLASVSTCSFPNFHQDLAGFIQGDLLSAPGSVLLESRCVYVYTTHRHTHTEKPAGTYTRVCS